MERGWQMAFVAEGVDRAADLRGRDDLLATPGARITPFWRGRAGVTEDRLARLSPDHPVFDDGGAVCLLLGREPDGTLHFAREVTGIQDTEAEEIRHPRAPGVVFEELRALMPRLPSRDGSAAATARAVLGWHRSHRFCAACGAESLPGHWGWHRDCPACATPHFPRTDPVVIMLITRGNSVLLGRSPGWPEGMYSLLAGFVEPGETMEDAVRRETFEETGVRVGPVRYLASQPWPFPSSLMLGTAGEAVTEAITLDPKELDDALWVPREEMAEVFAGTHPAIRAPRPGAIAGTILRNWLADRTVPAPLSSVPQLRGTPGPAQ